MALVFGNPDGNRMGEFLLARELESLPHNYLVINSYRLSNFSWTVDYLIVSDYAVYLLNVENYRGEVRKIFSDNAVKIAGQANEIQHRLVYTLSERGIDVIPITIYPAVPSSRIRRNIRSGWSVPPHDLRDFLMCEAKHIPKAEFSIRDKKLIFDVLQQNADEATREYIRSSFAVLKQEIKPVELFVRQQNSVCPRCGMELLYRVSDHYPGSPPFYGCSGYPDCRYTKPATSSESGS